MDEWTNRKVSFVCVSKSDQSNDGVIQTSFYGICAGLDFANAIIKC